MGLVPRLRFPEFREAGVWKVSSLGLLGGFIRGLTYSASDVSDDGLLVLRSTNIQDGSLILDKDLVFVSKGCSSELLLRNGDVVICMSNGSKALVGKNGEYFGNYRRNLTIGAFCSVFRPKLPFAKLIFQTECYSDFVSLSIGGGNINNLKNSVLEKFKAIIPQKKEEQEKIAGCISSLNALIAVQADKLDALKTHKKGLMQQLFPREGETVPRLRFPEFSDAEEWETTRLGEIASIRSGSTPPRSDPTFYSGGNIPWVKTTDLNNGFIYSTEECITSASNPKINPIESVLVAMYGGFKQIGRTGFLKVPAATNQALSVLNTKRNKVIPIYLLIWLNANVEQWKRIASSSRKDPNITGSDVAGFSISFPRVDEQKKIAECLTSLDTLIAEQADKLDTLKTHRKGLMQQLFPNPEAVAA